jgi:hypothetical protein
MLEFKDWSKLNIDQELYKIEESKKCDLIRSERDSIKIVFQDITEYSIIRCKVVSILEEKTTIRGKKYKKFRPEKSRTEVYYQKECDYGSDTDYKIELADIFFYDELSAIRYIEEMETKFIIDPDSWLDL